MRTVDVADLEAVLGKREADKILQQVEAAHADILIEEDIELFVRWLNRESKLGQGSTGAINRVAREFFRANPRVAATARKWAESWQG